MGWWRLTWFLDTDCGYLDEAWLLVRLLDGVEDLQSSFVIDGLCTSLATLQSDSVGPSIQGVKH